MRISLSDLCSHELTVAPYRLRDLTHETEVEHKRKIAELERDASSVGDLQGQSRRGNTGAKN